MAEFVVDATGAGSFGAVAGGNGEDDTIIVNIGPDFSGTIQISSSPFDGEIESTTVNLPEGWSLQLTGQEVIDDVEDPAYKNYSYVVLNADGQEVGTLSVNSNVIDGAPCFTRGTLIRTPQGDVAIEQLAPGDLVLTRDRGAQPVRWIGSTRLGAAALAALPHLRPIRIAAGALAEGLPNSDLLVSPQHRVLVRSRIAQRMFCADEVLVAARQLLDVPGITVADDVPEVEYIHMLFEQHEVVISNGAQTESLYPGAQALKFVGRVAAEEIFTLFPELRAADHAPMPARTLPGGRQSRQLARRHVQNGRGLQ
ncbi:Hint domain-containing protein [Paracoccus sp. PAR01]|uniref:Hint domain-containing protein n=1 Tax=Paracoccus sp. PAR01 TaxID=2769282 RepID=UPI001786F97E|nr:Hint domain-containing protein [Paracoccus sp. PAR01]MBD9526531.1 Hint domain-containing protein [Paracoccus sp. PAR01]